jgi:thioredoxin 1
MKVLKFGAVWCNGCIIMKPRWQEIEEEHDWLETEYYDVDENEEMAEQYEIEDVPTFVFLNEEGEELERMTGEIDKQVLIDKIKQYRGQ